MKLRNAFFALATLTIVSTGAITGCAADTDAQDADDADVEDTSDELNAAGKKLIGSYKDDGGRFTSLVLTATTVGPANKFSADVDTGIRCITTPCPSSEHIEGTFTAGSKTITLKSTTVSAISKPLLGKYSYLAQGSKLTLFRKDFSQSLEKLTAPVTTCMSSQSCGAAQHCSVEDGVCNSSGMLAVCSGTCVPNQPGAPGSK